MSSSLPPRIPTPALHYSNMPGIGASARPGILTAVGVISICLGSVGLLVNAFSILVTGLAFAATPHHIANSYVAPISPPPPTVVSTEYVAPNGLPLAERKILVDGLCQVHPLSDARRERVDALLSDAGKRIFHFSMDSLTAEHVAATVTSYNPMPRGTDGPPDDVYILGTGRLQVSDETAVFFPAGNPAGIRSEGGSFTDSTGSHLAAVQISGVVQQVQTLCNHAMNATQLSTLQGRLSEPDQKIINPSQSVAGAVAQVRSATVLADGTVGITTDNNRLSFGPNGEVVPGIIPASGAGLAKSSQFWTRSQAGSLLLEAMLSLGAAGFLLMAGVLVMKNFSNGRRFHLIFAIGKILLAAFLAYEGWTISQDDGTRVLFMAVAVLGAIYPIALLIVMNMSTARDFYKASTVNRVY